LIVNQETDPETLQKITFVFLKHLKMKLFAGLLLVIGMMAGIDEHFDDLHINQVQMIGSHNSYKQAIDPILFKLLSRVDSATVSKFAYSHISLTEQLDLGLRGLEIDVYADAKGGKYMHPKGLDWAPGQQPYDTAGEMKEPGFKVFHIQDIDFRSNCPTFKGCLQELKRWSEAHRDHYPVFITMNAKDEDINKPGFTLPEKFTGAIFDQLDQAIVEGLGRERVITPDDIRGKYSSLEEAVRAGNWPTLKRSKGKFIFILDETGDKRAVYISGHPSLKGRLLFVNADPGMPEAAIVIRNNPKKDDITALVEKGYIVRTRADSDTYEARMNDQSVFESACNSGAQIISTDYYRKSRLFNSDYIVRFKDGVYFRKNPVVAK
jgi:calcium-dependent phosphoinositide phospholipase C